MVVSFRSGLLVEKSTSACAIYEGSVHFTIDVRRDQGPNVGVGGHRALPSDFHGNVINFYDASLAAAYNQPFPPSKVDMEQCHTLPPLFIHSISLYIIFNLIGVYTYGMSFVHIGVTGFKRFVYMVLTSNWNAWLITFMVDR